VKYSSPSKIRIRASDDNNAAKSISAGSVLLRSFVYLRCHIIFVKLYKSDVSIFEVPVHRIFPRENVTMNISFPLPIFVLFTIINDIYFYPNLTLNFSCDKREIYILFTELSASWRLTVISFMIILQLSKTFCAWSQMPPASKQLSIVPTSHKARVFFSISENDPMEIFVYHWNNSWWKATISEWPAGTCSYKRCLYAS